MNLDRLTELWKSLTGRQRIQIVVAGVGTLALIWIMVQQAQRVRFTTLFTGLAPEDSNAIVSHLKDAGIPYRLEGGGSVVEVPVSQLDEMRLELAAEGLTGTGGGSGFELFDKPSFGSSTFVQNVNYQRAMERELARTIQSIGSVRSARVHLALPPDSLFADEGKRPSASVVVGLRPGRTVEKERVRAIVNLVASGVEGLAPSDVAVIDTDGRVLSDPGEMADEMMTSSQAEARVAMEKRIESTLVTLLEPIVGVGKVRALATVELNLRRVDRVEETYDPNVSVVRSEQKSKTTGSVAGGAGAPGAAANVGAGAAGASPTSPSQSQQTVTNFEVNKTVATISEPLGSLARQSVAVVVDHALQETTQPDGTVQQTPTPRTPQEMQQIEDLVRAAIGFDASRRDELTVENAPFAAQEVLEPVGGNSVLQWLPLALRFATLPLAVLLLAFLVVRPALTALRSAGGTTAPALAGAEGLPGGPPTVGELEARLADRSPEDVFQLGPVASPLQQRLMEAIREDPSSAALVVRSWMEEGDDK